MDLKAAIVTAVKRKHFLICAAILAVSGAGFHTAVAALQLYFVKKPLPLRKPLSEIPDRIGTYEKVEDLVIPAEQLEALGTEHYLQRIYRDTRGPSGGPGSIVRLFVGYYTGMADTVPHVPDRCLVLSGMTKVAEGDVRVHVAEMGAPGDELVVHRSSFLRVQAIQQMKQTVLYFFAVNGGFMTNPYLVRTRLASPFDRYNYFAKIEILFLGADAERSVTLAEEFLQQVGPEIVKCLPDWEAVKRGEVGD